MAKRRAGLTAIMVFSLLMATIGCKDRSQPADAASIGAASADLRVSATSAAGLVTNPTGTALASSGQAAASGSATSSQPPLPPLKPIIGKPFPEGASQAVVCEAIHSKEPDLWARFGHLVPLFEQGAIFVLSAGEDRHADIEEFVRKKYIHPLYPQQASCDGKTLLYVRSLPIEAMFGSYPIGQKHFADDLAKRLRVTTVERYDVPPDKERFAAYCRQDAEVCDRIVRLDISAADTGLCVLALAHAGAGISQEQYLQRCLELPPRTKVCGFINWERGESEQRRACICKLRSELGADRSPDCEPSLPPQ